MVNGAPAGLVLSASLSFLVGAAFFQLRTGQRRVACGDARPVCRGRRGPVFGMRTDDIRSLLLQLVRPAPADVSPALLEGLTRRDGWLGFCTLLHWAGLAPLAYRRLRHCRAVVPDDVLRWLQVQYYQRVGRNRFLLEELRAIVEEFDHAGIEIMILKGHALARHAQGLGRVFGDLDLLVRPDDSQDAARVLVAIGYKAVADQNHPFHHRYVRERGRIRTPVELHLDVSRKDSVVRPDVAAIWSRSAVESIFGLRGRVPDLTDHLLLVMLQLLHHHWSLRLLSDLGQVIWERPDEIDWPRLQESATAWGMRALAGSALYVLASDLRVALPESIRTFVEPENYLRRVQWRIAEAAVAERLNGRSARISRLAKYMFLDRWEDLPSAVARKALAAARPRSESPLGRALRSLAVGAAASPEILMILLKSLAPLPYPGGSRASLSERAVWKDS